LTQAPEPIQNLEPPREKGQSNVLQLVVDPIPTVRVGFIALGPDAHDSLTETQIDSLMTQYEHPFIKEIGEFAKKVGGHGGMDFIMDYRLIYCLRNGLPLDQDVYDAAEWSSLVELSEQSVLNGEIPVKIPDFTRGDWDKLNGLKFAP
jgi:hypothetical protein